MCVYHVLQTQFLWWDILLRFPTSLSILIDQMNIDVLSQTIAVQLFTSEGLYYVECLLC